MASDLSTFANGAAGSTARTAINTLITRFQDVINVKDYGATGDGSTNDTTAVQAALDAAFAKGNTAGGGEATKGAILFFPPGGYYITSALNDTAAGAGACVTIMGSGPDATRLFGDVDGFIIDKSMHRNVANQGHGISSIVSIRDIQVVNSHATAYTGAIRMNFVVGASILNCRVTGFVGIDASCNVFGLTIRDTNVAGPGGTVTGSVGIALQQGAVIGGKMNGWDNAIRMGGGDTDDAGYAGYNPGGAVGITLESVGIEECNKAIVIGTDLEGNTTQANGVSIISVQTEGCNTSISVGSASGLFVGGCAFTGTVWTDASPLICGIKVSSVNGAVFAGNTVAQAASNAKIDISSSSGSDIAFIGTYTGTASGGGVAWSMPTTNKSAYSFTNCDNSAFLLTFADLPASPIEGMQFDLSDANVSAKVLGDTISAGSSSGHIRVRRNNSAWKWMSA